MTKTVGLRQHQRMILLLHVLQSSTRHITTPRLIVSSAEEVVCSNKYNMQHAFSTYLQYTLCTLSSGLHYHCQVP